MKLLAAVLLIGWTVVAQDVRVDSQPPLTQAQQDALAVTTVDSGDNRVEVILTAVITVLGILLKVYHGWNAKNDAIATTLIRGIEAAGNSATVKAAVRTLAAEEGNTSILHKKVQKVTENDTPTTPDSSNPATS